MQKLRLPHLLVFLVVLMIVMHPYTNYGKPGQMAVLFLAGYSLYCGLGDAFLRKMLVPCLCLMAFSAAGALSSAAHGIPQLNHLAAVVSLLMLVLAGRGVFLYCQRARIGFDDLLLILLLVVVANSMIVLLEIQFDPLRQAIESVLDPILSGTINYASGYRLRGIATTGGASLSIAIPAAIVIALYLFNRGRIHGLLLMVFFFILLASVVVIGRSGVVLIAIPVLAYLLMLMHKDAGFWPIVKKILVACVILAVLLPFFFQFITAFFTEMFGEAFIQYAFGFLLEGGEGIREEGTVSLIADFLTVLPLQFPEAITGFGFYGGSDFFPWTDSGYSRTFLSIGFVLGLAFYVIMLRMFLLVFKGNKFLIGSLLLILLISEAKEPLLYSGVVSRMFILILVFRFCEQTEGVAATAQTPRIAVQSAR